MSNQALVEQMIQGTIGILHREYPNGNFHFLRGDEDLCSPHTQHPAFYGCLDWHSSVHSHWQLVRAVRRFPDAAFVPDAMVALDRSLTHDKMAGELAYLSDHPRFEMPYGMAWLLQLAAELFEYAHEEGNTAARRWRKALASLETHAAARFHDYLASLPYPVRGGLHNQTAFSLGLALDWARTVGDADLGALIETRALEYFGADVDAPLAYEPAAIDFLSPALAEADLMRRVLRGDVYRKWLNGFLGDDVGRLETHLKPVEVTDFANGQLAHLAGLNMSRAWMLEGIRVALPVDDRRAEGLARLAERHQTVGLPAALNDDYMVTHWAPTFVLYLLTGRGAGAGDKG